MSPSSRKPDTAESRRSIGFPEAKTDWCTSSAAYSEHNLVIAGHPVMQDWEEGYMAALAGIVGERGGRTLEIGYGLGLSTRHVLKMDAVEEHWIIECHPDVVSRALEDLRDELAVGRAHLVSGFWEDVVDEFADEHFDGILFDTYPLSEDEIHANHFPFFTHAHRLLRPGGVFTYYSDEESELSTSHLERLHRAGFFDIEWTTVRVQPPADCEYWQASTIVAPVVRK